METNRIEELIGKYNEGLADPSEIKLLEKMIEEGSVSLTRLHELHKLDEQLFNMDGPAPTMRLDDEFYAALATAKKAQRNVSGFAWPEWSFLMPRLAFAAALVIAGFVGGYFLQKPAENNQVGALTKEVSDLKEMMMLSLLEQESPTDRLRAVSLTSEMSKASLKVTDALLKTLNEDDNINVRLAALDALKPFVHDGRVRAELIRSIARQESPVVQVEMAGLMVAIQEKKSVKEFQRIIDNEKTPVQVKNRIKESIKVLI